MLKWRWPGSIQRRFSAGELGSFFFEKLQVDLEPPDLLIQFGRIDALSRLDGLFLEGRFHDVFVAGPNVEFIPINVGIRLGGS